MRYLFRVLVAIMSVLFPYSSDAQIPRTISYQGVLADSISGNAMDGEFDFVFKLFDAEVGGVRIWKSDVQALKITKGLFSTGLGPFGPEVKFDKPYWLDIEVAGKVLSPRIPLTSVGYSFGAVWGDTAMVSITSVGDTTWQTNGADIYWVNGNVGIGTTSPTAKLEVVGRTKTQVLEITGGMDLAEPFEMSESQSVPKGALVIIDGENPGRLKLSFQAYDNRVAGVVSGAGGINPGLTLTQQGGMDGGQKVALSGRVYALATAANGPIKPGDLLTTSDIPGYAMKATDRDSAFGAVIGKAMSSLHYGEGLVLVLVSLQ